MRSPRKRQGSVPQRGAAKKTLFSADNQDMETDWTDTSSASDNTILLESNDDSAGVQIVGKKNERVLSYNFFKFFFCLKNV